MTLTRPGYRPRLVDGRVELMMRTFGAVCIEGPKFSGKTWTALNHAESATMLGSPDGNFENLRLAEIDPSFALDGEEPHLVDEWQEVPAIWDAVRDRVDGGTGKGRFLLTGSSTPRTKGVRHSGNGRIGSVRMGTMSLFESGDSDGSVSLSSMFDGSFVNVACRPPSLESLVGLAVRGGWPGVIGLGTAEAVEFNRSYVRSISDRDAARMDDRERDSRKFAMLIRSLARNESTVAGIATLVRDMRDEDDTTISQPTVSDYLDALGRLFLTVDQPAFDPNHRSSKRVGRSAKRHLADPALAIAALEMTPDMLIRDLSTFGFMFEALCERDLRVYAEADGGRLMHYRDADGREIDAVVEMPDGRWGAFEVKLGTNQIDEAARSLLACSGYFGRGGGSTPEFLCVVCGMSSAAYRRPDGVYVVPITALRNRWPRRPSSRKPASHLTFGGRRGPNPPGRTRHIPSPPITWSMCSVSLSDAFRAATS